METLEWIRFGLGSVFFILGVFIFAIELMGVFRFRYVLNRMQVAATGDTLGLGVSLVGLMILSGWNFTTLKFFLVIMFLWCSSPVSSHMVARLEVMTNPRLGEYCALPEEIREEKAKEPAAAGDRLETLIDIDGSEGAGIPQSGEAKGAGKEGRT